MNKIFDNIIEAIRETDKYMDTYDMEIRCSQATKHMITNRIRLPLYELANRWPCETVERYNGINIIEDNAVPEGLAVFYRKGSGIILAAIKVM